MVSFRFVRFAGVQRGDALRSLYASASVFVFASVIDTLGLVNMEAMASGVPRHVRVRVVTDAEPASQSRIGLSREQTKRARDYSNEPRTRARHLACIESSLGHRLQ